MGKVVGWIVVIAAVFFAYQAGFFNSILDYFALSAAKAGQEETIQNPDGSITTVRYKNIFNILFDK